MASSTFLTFTVGIAAQNVLMADGTSGAPALAYLSEPTLGFYRSGAAAVSLVGSLTISTVLFTPQITFAQNRGAITSPADAHWQFQNVAGSIGSRLKTDALPTIASGFGTNAAITAGSTPFAGSINVGTGGVANSGVINFNGTAFPSAPFAVVSDETTGLVCNATTSTTQLTISTPVAWAASDVIAWICVSAK